MKTSKAILLAELTRLYEKRNSIISNLRFNQAEIDDIQSAIQLIDNRDNPKPTIAKGGESVKYVSSQIAKLTKKHNETDVPLNNLLINDIINDTVSDNVTPVNLENKLASKFADAALNRKSNDTVQFTPRRITKAGTTFTKQKKYSLILQFIKDGGETGRKFKEIQTYIYKLNHPDKEFTKDVRGYYCTIICWYILPICGKNNKSYTYNGPIIVEDMFKYPAKRTYRPY
ncbi:MAG: hypothetical protein WC979_00250 [Candidatus Pacearchaeota archaeon]|jgi:hypothetical protein|nr:hypothetical protein [Clostridia bacterium]